MASVLPQPDRDGVVPRWATLLRGADLIASLVGREVSAVSGDVFANLVTKIEQIFAVKATATLVKRVGTLERFTSWALGQPWLDASFLYVPPRKRSSRTSMFFQVLGWQVAGGEKALEHANDFEVLGVNFKLSSGLDPAHVLVAAKA
eukprot:1094281-Amphidinium_carterae.1